MWVKVCAIAGYGGLGGAMVYAALEQCGSDAFDIVAAIADDVIRELVNREVAGICGGDD